MENRSAEDRAVGPFEHHMREAIALNRHRAPVYAAASNGTSRRVSWVLMAIERMLLPLARSFDRADAPYARAGVPLLSQLLMPMPRGPALDLSWPAGDPMAVRPPGAAPPKPLQIWRDVRRACRRAGFVGAAGTLEEQLEVLSRYPASDCMLRHMLESAQRVAGMAGVLRERAATAGLRDPSPLLRRLFHLHLWGLPAAAALDRLALGVQRQGVPILQYDLPHVPAVGEPKSTLNPPISRP